jgi:hypothetical protein
VIAPTSSNNRQHHPVRSIGLFQLPHRRHSRRPSHELASSSTKKRAPTFNSPPPGCLVTQSRQRFPCLFRQGPFLASLEPSVPSAPIKRPLLIAQPRLADSNGAVSAQHGVDFRSRDDRRCGLPVLSYLYKNSMLEAVARPETETDAYQI